MSRDHDIKQSKLEEVALEIYNEIFNDCSDEFKPVTSLIEKQVASLTQDLVTAGLEIDTPHFHELFKQHMLNDVRKQHEMITTYQHFFDAQLEKFNHLIQHFKIDDFIRHGKKADSYLYLDMWVKNFSDAMLKFAELIHGDETISADILIPTYDCVLKKLRLAFLP